jgi:hypothetical protein
MPPFSPQNGPYAAWQHLPVVGHGGHEKPPPSKLIFCSGTTVDDPLTFLPTHMFGLYFGSTARNLYRQPEHT